MITRVEIDAQRGEYAKARASIDALPNALERDIGLAALRLEATATYKQLITTATNLEPGALDPLQEYVAALVGGERSQALVQFAEKRAQQEASSLFGTVVTGALTGKWVLAGLFGLLASFGQLAFGFFTEVGANLGVALATGLLPVGALFYALRTAAPAAQQAAEGSWAWAENLGGQADQALRSARIGQANLWKAAGGSAAPPGATFTTKARGWAQLTIVAMIAVFALGVACVGYGVIQAFEDVNSGIYGPGSFG